MVENARRMARVRWSCALTFGLTLVLCEVSALAQPSPTANAPDRTVNGAAADRPWAAGVSPEDQERALERFGAGNALLDEALFKVALDKYREALALWDHPAIRYNMAVCQINLDQPIEAYESIQAALRWGPDPLDAEIYAQSLTYKRLLERQLARFAVRCDLPGATVTLDGRTLVTCPGEHREALQAGRYQLVATKPGFLPRTYRLLLVGGEERTIDVELLAVEETRVTTRRWDAWKPWALLGAGAAVALAGVPFARWSDTNYATFDRAVDAECGDRACYDSDLPREAVDARDRALLEKRVAIGLVTAGALAVCAGATLLLFNQPRSSYRGYANEEALARALAPWIDGQVVGVMGRVNF